MALGDALVAGAVARDEELEFAVAAPAGHRKPHARARALRVVVDALIDIAAGFDAQVGGGVLHAVPLGVGGGEEAEAEGGEGDDAERAEREAGTYYR